MSLVLSSIFLFTFGFFNLLGILPSLAFTQLINFCVGLIIFFLIKKIRRQPFQINSSFFYWFFVFVLVITYIIGYEVKGSKRWIDFYLFNFQASEFFKIFFIVYFANFFSEKSKELANFSIFLQSFFFFIIPTTIILKQPDLGNALVFVFIYLTMIVFFKVPKKFLLSLIGIMFAFSLLIFFSLKDYQKMRLASFINPHIDRQGTSYNMIQATIAVGSGGLFGRGLGRGTQSKLSFLPENRTDFAFSALVEQFGFLGGFILVSLYLIIILLIAQRTVANFHKRGEEGHFKFFYSLGFLSYIFVQFFVNVGMNLGLLPVAGIALPLISYGGSSVVTWMVGLALLP